MKTLSARRRMLRIHERPARKHDAGFTLIEIAIVLVIMGLLLSGVLRGQELIKNARVRNLIQQMDGMKAAYFGFLDRFRALPGDYISATTNIGGIAATAVCNNGNGDGNGQIVVANNENILAWEHLAKAGFITGTYVCSNVFSVSSSPTSVYGQYLNLVYDANYAGAAANSRHNVKTGGQIPSDILLEIDRKIDDGDATRGAFRAQIGGGVDTTTTNCYAATGAWVATPPGGNCGAATLF